MNIHLDSKQPRLFKRTLLGLAMASSFGANNVTFAEEVNLETVQVFGQAAQLDKALKEQRNSNSIESVVHADGIGQLPDDNAAEALQRIPGVSVEQDQGEGRFVSVRGLAPELNNVNINGTNIPSPESGTRAVALDVLPSELIQSLSVVKTLTPDMDANSLGGTINVRSLSAFDHDGLFYTLSGEGNYDSNVEKTSPKGSGAVSDIFSVGNGTNNLGIAAALSWQERDFGSDNVETGGAWDFSDGAKLEEFDQRDYQITRERLGFGLNFDYKYDNETNFYLRTLYSKFSDTETRQAASIKFDDALSAGEIGNDAEGTRELKDRKETQEVKSFVFGGDKAIGLWTVNGQIGYSQSSEDTPDHIAKAKFEGDSFNNVGFTDSRQPHLTASSSYYNPANFTLDKVELENQYTEDTEKNIKFDIARDFEINGYASQVKFGSKLSRREKTNDGEAWTYEGNLALADVTSGSVDYSLNQFGPAISTQKLTSQLGNLTKEYNEEDSRINDFEMHEDIDAAYVMNTLDLDSWTIITGLRYEHTDFKAQGTSFDKDSETFSSTTKNNSYGDLLPGLHARYYVDDNTQVRAAWTNTVVRPTFEALTPGVYIDDDKAEFGNPDLDPMKSSNLDLGIEHYMGRAGAVSTFVFYKDISDFVYNTDVAETPGAYENFKEAKTFANGDKAEVYGIEVAYNQKLDWLPGIWSGVIIGANATFSQSDAEISGKNNQREIDLPGQSKRVGNLMLGWENDKLSMRISTNYKSNYLKEVAAIEDKEHDLYVDSQVFVDFSASYFVTKHAQITFEAKNLTDEHYYVYTGKNSYNAQYEEYGPALKIGFTLTDF